jgi:hypothetical protein
MTPQELKLNLFRGIAIFITQVPVILIVGAKFDLIFGLNRMDSGFTILLLVFVLAPPLNLIWLIAEIIVSVKRFRYRSGALSILMPLIALCFLIESLAVDFYLLSQMRM